MRIVAFACCLSGIVCASTADACRCAGPPGPKPAMERSQAVFAGTVSAIEQVGTKKVVTFVVSRTWKGTKGKTIKVHGPISGAACGYGFRKGKAYMVYCYKTPKTTKSLHTNMCTRTRLLANAKQDLKDLGEGKKP